MPRKMKDFDVVMRRIRVDPNASDTPPPGLAAAVQFWPSVPSVDLHTIPHAVVPSIVLRWVVSPYAPVTVHSVQLSPAVGRSTTSPADLPAATQALCPPGPSPATVLAAGHHHSSLALSSGADVISDVIYDDGTGSDCTGSDLDESDHRRHERRCALCVIDGTKLMDSFLAIDKHSTLTIPISDTLVHDVVCVNVDPHPNCCEPATLQLCAAVACALRAASVHFSGAVESYTDECFGKRDAEYHPRVVDMSGLVKLEYLRDTCGFAPWRKLQRLVLPPLSADGHQEDAHFGLGQLIELSFGTAQRPSRLRHLGDSSFCFPVALEQVDFRPCPDLRFVGSLTFQGAESLRIVCFRGLKNLEKFGRRPFVQCGSLQLVDLRDIDYIPDATSGGVFDESFNGVVLVSDPTDRDSEQLQQMVEPGARAIEPGTEDAYPPDALLPDPHDETGLVLRVALLEAQYRNLPPFAPIPTGVECLCAHDHAEYSGQGEKN